MHVLQPLVHLKMAWLSVHEINGSLSSMVCSPQGYLETGGSNPVSEGDLDLVAKSRPAPSEDKFLSYEANTRGPTLKGSASGLVKEGNRMGLATTNWDSNRPAATLVAYDNAFIDGCFRRV